MTPLHVACYYGREGLVQLLIESGAALDALDSRGQTPLDYATAADRGMSQPAASAATAELVRQLGGRTGEAALGRGGF